MLAPSVGGGVRHSSGMPTPAQQGMGFWREKEGGWGALWQRGHGTLRSKSRGAHEPLHTMRHTPHPSSRVEGDCVCGEGVAPTVRGADDSDEWVRPPRLRNLRRIAHRRRTWGRGPPRSTWSRRRWSGFRTDSCPPGPGRPAARVPCAAAPRLGPSPQSGPGPPAGPAQRAIVVPTHTATQKVANPKVSHGRGECPVGLPASCPPHSTHRSPGRQAGRERGRWERAGGWLRGRGAEDTSLGGENTVKCLPGKARI